MYEKKSNSCGSLSGLIDIHSHILPGIDDGARTERESLKMLKMAAAAGIREIIATPHFHYRRGKATPEKVKGTIARMQEMLEVMKIPIRLYAGNELYYSHSLLDVVKAGEALTMAGSDYVLLEFSPETEKRKIQHAVYQFLCEGYNPIIAHAERYQAFLKHMDFAEEISAMGAYLQVNSDSLCGNAGWRIKRFSKKLVEEDLVSFAATDAHDTVERVPQFGKSIAWISKKYGQDQLQEYLIDNPKKILQNKTI